MFRNFLAAAAVSSLLATGAALAQDATPAPAAPVTSNAAPVAGSPNLTAAGSIAATLKASPHFTILSKALDQAQLTAVLNATPNLTLFAPTDEAFRALPPAQLAKLLTAENAPILQKLLIYHLVNAKLDAAKIKGAKGDITTVETSKLQLDGSGVPLKVNDADIIQADVVATNGTIHVIDKVLIPGDVKLPPA